MFASAGRLCGDRPNGRARRQNRSRNDQSRREACVPGRRAVRPPTQRHSLVPRTEPRAEPLAQRAGLRGHHQVPDAQPDRPAPYWYTSLWRA